LTHFLVVDKGAVASKLLLESLQEFFWDHILWVIPATWSKSSFRSSAEYEYEGNSVGIQRLDCLREGHPHQQKDRKSSGSARSCDVKR
jgi:hypothetical protein